MSWWFCLKNSSCIVFTCTQSALVTRILQTKTETTQTFNTGYGQKCVWWWQQWNWNGWGVGGTLGRHAGNKGSKQMAHKVTNGKYYFFCHSGGSINLFVVFCCCITTPIMLQISHSFSIHKLVLVVVVVVVEDHMCTLKILHSLTTSRVRWIMQTLK